MTDILNPIQIKNSTVRLNCGEVQGTGFFISNNTIITALHVVLNYNHGSSKILMHLNDGSQFEGTIFASNEELDICLISVRHENKSFLPLQAQTIKYNENFESFGFPYINEGQEDRLTGKVNQIQIDQRSNFILKSDGIDRHYDYSGFSGSPVIMSNKVGGIVLQQIDDKLAAISISKIKAFLISNNIPFEEEINILEVPEEFEEDIKTSTPNYAIAESIDEIIKDGSNWFLLSGSPGSGKTLSVATYIPSDNDVDVCGRYFVKVPNEKSPKSLKTSNRYFLHWLEELIFVKVTGFPAPIEDKSFEKRIEQLSSLFDELSNYYQSISKKALIIIDGLDEILDLRGFLDIIPLKLPENIKILLSCTSKEILPTNIKSVITDKQSTIAVPINIGQCEAFILKEIGQEKLSIETIQQLAIKSEGHPLYLRYLVNYIKKQDADASMIEDWINEIPTISGDIRNYYESIWDSIYSASDKLWITIILSQLRQPISKEDLINILPIEYKMSFYSHFQSLRYLLKENELLEIYHNSFKDFIINKTSLNTSLANNHISEFCKSAPQNKYSINNLLYHLSLSSNPEKSIDSCNQEWADKCAIENVSPDLIISDVKNIINISIDFNRTVDTIRLLVLLQRVEFRYDSVFAENANLIANALIAVGNFEAALTYLVRDNTLLVDNTDAIVFLQMFYENESINEAKILFEAISKRYRRLINEGINSKEGISLETFVMQLNALTLSMNADFKEGLTLSKNLSHTLKFQQESAFDKGNTDLSEAIYNVREYSSSWQSAYVLRRFDIFVNSKEIAKVSNVKLDCKWARMRAQQIILFNELNNYNTGIFDKNEKYFLLIGDVEHLIENYGYTENKDELQILIYALIDNSKRSDLVSSLISKYLKYESEFNLRKPNGVDLNYQDVHDQYFRYKYVGYLDENNEIPSIPIRYKSWEEFSNSIIRSIAFLEGKTQRLKADNKLDEIDPVLCEFLRVIKKIDFSFEERCLWDRSYHLPELLYPLIYLKITNYLFDFAKEELINFLKSLKNYAQYQFGLYSEGYRKCLSDIIKELVKVGHSKDDITQLLEIWCDYVITSIENRWERTPELLKIIEIYGLIGNKLKAMEIFEEMLKTSMGPSWYKEDQLALLNTTLDLTHKDKSINRFIKEFAGLLDYASGEMTFQRYVRNEKEMFIGSLIKNDKIFEAIEYFKVETLPSPELLISNAEANTFDAPRIGDGYCLGARNIKEQSGVLEIIKSIRIQSSYLKWTLAEIFTINDDIFRYINDFGDIQSELLSFYEKTKDPNLEDFYITIADIAASKEMEDDRNRYLNVFKQKLSESGINCIQGNLLKNGISWGVENNQSISEEIELRDKKKDRFDLFNANYRKNNIETREDLINEGISVFFEEKISIWYSNWSTSSSEAKENLKSLFKTDIETINKLKDHINTYSSESWIIVNKLIWFLEGKLTLDQTVSIYKTISEHFTLLIRPNDKAFKKYEWIEKEPPEQSNDSLLLKFIIWLLNYPSTEISERTFKALLKLARYDATIVIPALIDEILRMNSFSSPVKCSRILKELSKTNPELIAEVLDKNDVCFGKLINIRHFTIKKHILDVAINLNRIGFKKLHTQLLESIPDSIILVGDVALEESFLEPISYEIDELNDLQILNRTFCETLLITIKEFCEPLSITELKKSDRYLKRSFHEEKYFEGRFKEILDYALNIAISPRVDKSNFSKVYDILNID